jgi:hypothetical protein
MAELNMVLYFTFAHSMGENEENHVREVDDSTEILTEYLAQLGLEH